MDLYEAVKQRRSVRKLKTDYIAQDVLDRILEAARWAPSWANVQATRWVVVQNPAIKEKLAETTTPGNPGRQAIINAPVVFALCFEKGISGYYKGELLTTIENWGLFDAGLAAANLTLAATAEGLGTVHVGAIHLEMAAEILGLPDNVQMVELIPLGIPEKQPNPTNRQEIVKFVFHDQYGG